MSSVASVAHFLHNLVTHLPIIIGAVGFVHLVGPRSESDETHDSELEGSDEEDSPFMRVMNA